MLLVLFVTLSITLPAQASGEHRNHWKEFVLSKQLKAISKKTYRYFEDFTDSETGLTFDAVRMENGELSAQEFTSPTNISMYMMSTISAEEVGLISRKEAVSNIEKTLKSLAGMEKWNGLFTIGIIQRTPPL